jgi:hypothetical protein
MIVKQLSQSGLYCVIVLYFLRCQIFYGFYCTVFWDLVHAFAYINEFICAGASTYGQSDHTAC